MEGDLGNQWMGRGSLNNMGFSSGIRGLSGAQHSHEKNSFNEVLKSVEMLNESQQAFPEFDILNDNDVILSKFKYPKSLDALQGTKAMLNVRDISKDIELKESLQKRQINKSKSALFIPLLSSSQTSLPKFLIGSIELYKDNIQEFTSVRT
jgi:hypothetical protein